MARHSSDREDLMAEMVALFPRISLTLPEFADPIVAGQHSDGRWSIYFGGDPVYHFDSDDRLRRAFVDGSLYRSQGTTLARLTRQETSTETLLLRYELDSTELASFLGQMCVRLGHLARSFKVGTATTQQSVPEDAEFEPELVRHILRVLLIDCQLAPTLKK